MLYRLRTVNQLLCVVRSGTTSMHNYCLQCIGWYYCLPWNGADFAAIHQQTVQKSMLLWSYHDINNRLIFAVEQLKSGEETQQKIIAAAAGMHAKSQLALDTPYSSTCSLYSSPYAADRSATSGEWRKLSGASRVPTLTSMLCQIGSRLSNFSYITLFCICYGNIKLPI